MSKKGLLRDAKRVQMPQSVKDWIDSLIAEGVVGPTVFVRENPDGSPCYELKARVIGVGSKK